MAFSEADTRAKLIDPALHARGWTEELIRREETSGAIDVVDGVARKRSRGRIDYTLRVRVNPSTQPVALALVEAKAESLPPDMWDAAESQLRSVDVFPSVLLRRAFSGEL